MNEWVTHDIDQETMRCRDCGMDYGEILSEELSNSPWAPRRRRLVECVAGLLTFPAGEVENYRRGTRESLVQ